MRYFNGMSAFTPALQVLRTFLQSTPVSSLVHSIDAHRRILTQAIVTAYRGWHID